MARKYVDTIVLTKDGKDFDDMIVDFTEKRNRKTTAVNTLNKARRAKGFKRGNVMFSGTMTVEESDDQTAPNWDDILNNGTLFKFSKKPSAGKRVTFVDVTVEDISDNYSDGDSKRTLSWQALDRVIG